MDFPDLDSRERGFRNLMFGFWGLGVESLFCDAQQSVVLIFGWLYCKTVGRFVVRSRCEA